MTFDPILLLAMWSAGLAGCAAAVAWWGVARVGYLWLAGAVVVLVGATVAFAEPVGIVGLLAAAAGAAAARRPRLSAASFALAGVAYLAVASGRDSVLPAVAGALALGGITAEMLLGHWYLVDPALPRWALRRLTIVGVVGVVAEAVVAGARGTMRPPTDLFGAAYLMLIATTLVLTAGVWFSLREKGYEGVMAATGLSYLATLTVLGAAFLGRAPVEEFLGIT